jgi:hypothetical protein
MTDVSLIIINLEKHPSLDLDIIIIIKKSVLNGQLFQDF